MRKISAMYQWSGGTDPMHRCGECKNCITRPSGKKEIAKCKSYGDLETFRTDWNPNWIACKAFDRKPPKEPVYKPDENEVKQEWEK